MIGIGSNKKIIDLYNSIKSKELILQPDFQRKLVWNSSHKESFIDTILSGLPFPEIYTAAGDINLSTRKAEVIVVDGQQRLSTIYEYIEDAKGCFEYKKIKRFIELTEDEQKEFFYYVVVVRDLGSIPIEDIKKIFRRINSVDYALEAMEINNALYDGEYIRVAKNIQEYMNLYDTFKETEISRMKDLEFILAVMATNDMKGYFTGYKEVESFVKNYNEEYKEKDKTLEDFRLVNDLIVKLELDDDSIWVNSRSCYFTILVEFLKVIDKIDISDKLKMKKIREELSSFNDKVMQNRNINKKDDNEYSMFYKAMYQGTSSRKNRVIRGKMVEKLINKCI